MGAHNKEEYRSKLLDPRWQKMRLEVLSRDDWKCICCGEKSETLHAHHTYYDQSSEGPWDYPAASIVTLCASCHEAEHQAKRHWMHEFNKTLSGFGAGMSGTFSSLCEALQSAHGGLDHNDVRVLVGAIRDLIDGRNNAVIAKSEDEFTTAGKRWRGAYLRCLVKMGLIKAGGAQ